MELQGIEWRPTTEEESLSISEFSYSWPILYSFTLSSEFYNSLPFKICKLLMRTGHGNSLYLTGARHPVDLTLTKEEFIMFNELLYAEMGHS